MSTEFVEAPGFELGYWTLMGPITVLFHSTF
jgi:hypothetical protein